MPKRIIILERNPDTGVFTVLYWCGVPAGREARWLERQGNPTASRWPGAVQAEHDAIASGSVVEFPESYSRGPGTDMATAEADLEARWRVIQDEVTNLNPWNRHGSFWDGTSWTVTGVS